MSCWRVLQLSDQLDGENVPQLLIKPRFSSDSYTIFLTDLSNIWSEELDSAGLVGRASEEESPIEVSKQETTQLAILLQNVQKSLANTDDTTCRIVRATADDVVLHTTISLPEPLDSLRWRFHLRKRTSVTLKNELVLPLLVSSHIQHEKISNLVATITEKDRVITRLLDQYESSNLDLAAAFPSISGLKSGRRLLKRDQAARHIPGLQPFHQDSWKRETAELHDTDVSTLSLFQEALSECTPKVPPRLESEDSRNTWWTSIATALHDPKPTMKPKANPIPEKAEARAERKVPAPESDDDETEDEFETHENFKVSTTWIRQHSNVEVTVYCSCVKRRRHRRMFRTHYQPHQQSSTIQAKTNPQRMMMTTWMRRQRARARPVVCEKHRQGTEPQWQTLPAHPAKELLRRGWRLHHLV